MEAGPGRCWRWTAIRRGSRSPAAAGAVADRRHGPPPGDRRRRGHAAGAAPTWSSRPWAHPDAFETAVRRRAARRDRGDRGDVHGGDRADAAGRLVGAGDRPALQRALSRPRRGGRRRWTELAAGRLDPLPLISHRLPLEEARARATSCSTAARPRRCSCSRDRGRTAVTYADAEPNGLASMLGGLIEQNLAARPRAAALPAAGGGGAGRDRRRRARHGADRAGGVEVANGADPRARPRGRGRCPPAPRPRGGARFGSGCRTPSPRAAARSSERWCAAGSACEAWPATRSA